MGRGFTALLLVIATNGCSDVSARQAKGEADRANELKSESVEAVEIYTGPEDRSARLPIRFERLTRVGTGDVKIVGGESINPKDFPATVQSRARANCSATLIGPQVLLTAAHCVDAAQELSSGFPMTIGGSAEFDKPYDLIDCAMSDAYAKAPPSYTLRPRMAQDWALCQLKTRPSGARPENIALTPLSAASTAYFMLGFGCSAVERKNGTLVGLDKDGVLRAGVGKLKATNVDFAGNAGGFALAQSGAAGPSLCPGDSGGGSMTGIDLKSMKGSREVVMVNSALGSTGENSSLVLYSYFAPLGTGAFETFARQWAGNLVERKICGLHIPKGQPPCRA